MIRYIGDFPPFFVERAEGAYVYDDSGRRILDFTSGQMCATLGHNHPAVVAAIQRSCERAIHLFSWLLAPEVVELCRELAALLPPQLQKVILLNTGSESNEAAIRMAKLATGGHEVVGLSASFHGLTGGAGAATYSVGRRGYGPGVPGNMAIPAPNAYRCPIRHCTDACDLACLEVGFELIDQQSTGQPAAAIAEPVISTGGVIVPPAGYFPRLRELCRARGMLLIIDEAQTAFGRLGANFAFEQDGVVPDFVTLSKTLGGGVPLAATVTSAEIEATCYERGFVHVTSHESDPLPAAVGLAVLEVLRREQLAAPRARAWPAPRGRSARPAAALRSDRRRARSRAALGGRAGDRPAEPHAPSRARRQDHPALPGARPFDEHRLAAPSRQRLADRAAPDLDQRADRRRTDHPRSGDSRAALGPRPRAGLGSRPRAPPRPRGPVFASDRHRSGGRRAW